MDNKLLKFLLLSILPVWMLASCTDEVAIDNQTAGISLKILLNESTTRSSVDPGTDSENNLQDVGIWLFKKFDLDEPCVLYRNVTVNGSEAYVTFTNKEVEEKGIDLDTTRFVIYAVANTKKNSITALDDKITLNEIKGLVFKKTYNMTDGGRPISPFLMSGMLEYTFNKSKTATVTLVRTAVKLNVSVKDSTNFELKSLSVSIENDFSNVGVFSPLPLDGVVGIPFPANQKWQKNISGSQALLYINEYMGTTPLALTVQGKSGSLTYKWTVPLVFNGSGKLMRNTAYNINIRLGAYTPEVEVNAIPWSGVNTDDDQILLPD